MNVMTVSDLISELRKHNPSLLVVVDGYEEGFADEIAVHEVYLVRNEHGRADGIYGKHGRPHRDATRPQKGWNLHALFIGTGRNLHSGC